MKRLTRKTAFQLESLESRRLLSALTVTSAADNGVGSLRAQVAAAQSGDSINFDPGLAGHTITLTSGEIAITKNLTIEGPGDDQLAVSGNDSGRVFAITGSTTHAEIRNLTITHGSSNGGSEILNFGVLTVSSTTLSDNFAFQGGGGGAIFNDGTLTVSDSTLSGNYTFFGGDGAIFNDGTLIISGSNLSENTAHAGGAICNILGMLTISDSNLSGNYAIDASDGGGAISITSGAVTVSNCTIANNKAIGISYSIYDDDGNLIGQRGENASGGGLFVKGSGTLSIDHSTLAGNEAIGGPGDFGQGAGYGGGIYGGAIQLYDTIIADNDADYGPDVYVLGAVTSLGHNLIGNVSGTIGFVASDLLNVDPQLGPLQNNGGPTPTMAPLPGSPAINAGDNTNAPTYDQRGAGFPRIVGGSIDIGAFETIYRPTKTWTGPITGGNWSTASNWNPSGVPTASDLVILSGKSVTLPGGAAFANLTLTPGASVTLTSPLGSWTGSAYTGVTGMIQSRHIKASGSGKLTNLGVAPSGGDVRVMHTYTGDANLDGKLNIDDYTRIDSGVSAHLTGWSNGDFNYDGKINIDDYVIIDGNIDNQGPPFSNGSSIGDASTSTSAWVGQTAIAWSSGEQRRDEWADLLVSTDDVAP